MILEKKKCLRESYHTDSKKSILREEKKYLREKVFIPIAKNNI